MPKYKSHKEVWALKIKTMAMVDGELAITPEEEGFACFRVEAKYIPTHDAARPQVGWYFVQYENGYKSFSPADAFEKGYTRA